ncbi:hypothetical protein CDAR_68261 [Caerostris darwini]|uniref:Uncharacterized protein n=1 Tax=Caerostris darwini TaxID=1538125 RepID=A0AAV4WC57_9ARAC|nr:hypothetical protein CDAR_68261 [Caerostris darwini]
MLYCKNSTSEASSRCSCRVFNQATCNCVNFSNHPPEQFRPPRVLVHRISNRCILHQHTEHSRIDNAVRQSDFTVGQLCLRPSDLLDWIFVDSLVLESCQIYEGGFVSVG